MHRVAITGMGALTSIGIGKDNLWKGLLEGRSGARTVDHYDTEGHRAKFGALVDDFDPVEVLGKKALRRMDRTVQLGVAAGRQLIEDSGLELDTIDRSRIGILTGTCSPMDWVWNQHKTLFTKGIRAVSPFTVLCTFPDAAAANIGIDLGLNGMNLTLSSACSSSADAIGYAFTQIRAGIMERFIAGGVEAPVVANAMIAFGKARALSARNDSPSTASRPFDKGRDGFVMGEGSGLVLLERLDLALARGAHIYGELVGYGSTCDAYHMTVPNPNSEQQVKAMQMAIDVANLTADDVDYVNAHGTSTPLNDKTETQTLKNVFGKRAYDIPINSTKSMVGHTLGAAGGIELVTTLLQMQHNIVHPTINFQEADPDCDLDYVVEGPREHKIDVAVSSSFGFGGKNSILVVKRYEP